MSVSKISQLLDKKNVLLGGAGELAGVPLFQDTNAVPPPTTPGQDLGQD